MHRLALLLLLASTARAEAVNSAPAEAAKATPAKVELLWLGQSAVRITTPGGKVIVIDPFLTGNPKTPPAWKDLDALGKVDLLLVTHAHADHLGDAPALALKHRAPLYGLGPGLRVTMVRAEHSSELVYKNPQTGKEETHVGGEPVGFIVELENGFRIYHMGDTALFGDMKLIGERYHPDLLLVPIGGHFVMDPKDAAFATREWLKPKFALPFHYGTTPLLKGTPEEYVRALGEGAVKVVVLQPGEKTTF